MKSNCFSRLAASRRGQTHLHRSNPVIGNRNWQAVNHSLAVFIIFFILFSVSAIISSDRASGRTSGLNRQSTQEPREASRGAGDDQDVRVLEPGAPIKRELAGSRQQSYRIKLSAGQFLKVIVEQQGIDVVVLLSGPDGKQGSQGNQNWEFNTESRLRGQEEAPLVAEVTGEYRLTVRPAQKDARAGGYEIRIEELRAATESDRALQEARKLSEEARQLEHGRKYDEALRLYERALAIREKALGPDHPHVAGSLSNLANIYYFRGDFAKAEPLYERALAIREKTLGPDHPDVAASLNNLASIYNLKGDFEKAESFYQRALAIWEKALGPDHPQVTLSLDNLASLYRAKGDNTKAEPLAQRALAIKEKALGPEHPDVALSLNNLVMIYQQRGDYAKAEPLAQRALTISEKTLGPEHFGVAHCLNNLGDLYLGRGEYEKAEPMFQRALAIWEKTLRPEHPFIASSLANLAVLYAAKGAIAQAVRFQSRANAISDLDLDLNLIAGSERQKLALLNLSRFQTDSTLSLHAQVAPNDPQALDLAFTTWLRRKGRGLEAMADTIAILRRHAAPQDQQLFDQLADARSQLAALTLGESSTAKPETYRAQLASLREKADELEATLSSHSAEFRTQSQPVALAAVQSALPAGSVLVEFAAYRPHELPTEKRKPPRYLAYLLAPQGRPQWVDLGEVEVIDRAVEAWRRALRDPRRTDVKQLARGMDDKVMRPVRALLQSGQGEMRGKIRRLLIAPDGSLNLIPFAALVDEQGRYLVERYSISYLVSGRDLLRLQVRQPSKSEAVVVADPDYGETVVAAQLKRRDVGLPSGMPQTAGSNVSLSQVYFPPLRGTAGEARALKAMLPQATVLTGERATEARLKQLSSPKILHLATHGFFLRDQDPNSPVEISLLRSGLALAGANLRRGGPDPADDGILTALEAAGLDLWGTKLVVLSACDTGVGEVKVGEGVYGLRRALALAGAETQVMSLWPVSDTGTRDLMIGYYKALQRGEGRGEGLRRVQLEMIKSKDRRHPFYWAGFIQSGEWANLEGTR